MRKRFSSVFPAAFLLMVAQTTAAVALSLQGFGGGEGYFQPVFRDKADFIVSTAAQLQSAISSSHAGDVIYIEDNAVIDLAGTIVNTSTGYGTTIPQGVTLASGRGQNGSQGALLHLDYDDVVNNILYTFNTGGSDVRFTGLRLQGPFSEVGTYDDLWSRGIYTTHADLEVDNCEISQFALAGVHVRDGATDAYIHHNNIHHIRRVGYGYGVSLGNYIGADTTNALVEYNHFDYMRHSISGTGRPGESYEAGYNVVGPNATSKCFDMHGGVDRGDGTDIAGENISVHHNLFKSVWNPVVIRGQPTGDTEFYENWLEQWTTMDDAVYFPYTPNPQRVYIYDNVLHTSLPYDGDPPRNPPIGAVVQPGFESAAVGAGKPEDEGLWGGDYASIVGTEQGVTPRSGAKMLKALYTGSSAAAGSGVTCQIYQTVDVTAWRPAIEEGLVDATFSFYVNRIAGDAQTDTGFYGAIGAMNGFPSYFITETLDPATNPDYLGYFGSPVLASDGNTATWEQVSLTCTLPVGTDYLAICLLATENVYNDTTGQEFDGHYFDDVSLTFNTHPLAAADGYDVNWNGWFSVAAAGGVLANDTDDDGDHLTARWISQYTTQHGTLWLDADGGFAYVPEKNFTGMDAFYYKAFDGAAESDYGLCSLLVGPPEIPGDASRDGVVDVADAALLAANWLTGSDAFWDQGDFNGDGAVNDFDATILAANWGRTAAGYIVPEPAAVTLLLMLGLALLAFTINRNRRKEPDKYVRQFQFGGLPFHMHVNAKYLPKQRLETTSIHSASSQSLERNYGLLFLRRNSLLA